MTQTTVRLEVRGAVRDLFQTHDLAVCLAGPAGTGKSMGALFWLHIVMLQHPGTRALLLRKTHRALAATTLVTLREKVLPDARRQGIVSWYGGSGTEPASWRYANGSRVVVGGLDNPDKVLSSEYSVIMVDEASELTRGDVDVLLTRLRGATSTYPDYRLVMMTNPAAPTHHLRTAKDVRVVNSRHEDNPSLHDGREWTTEGKRYLAALDNLTGIRRLRLRDGVWAAAEGVIYSEFDDQVHVIDRLPDGAETWERFWSVDFGFTNPFVLQCWALDGDGRMYMYRELYRTKRLVEDHARDALALVTRYDGTWKEPKPSRIVCDHDAEDRATLERHLGLSTTAARKDVRPGIEAVQARLRPAADGRPRLYLVRGALVERDEELAARLLPTSTLEEFGGYVWEPPQDGRPSKDAPVKMNDHAMDATRYAVADRDLQGEFRIRWL